MAGTTQVTPAELATMAQKATDANAAVQGEIGRVRDTVGATRADWEGAAQARFTQLMADWDSDAAKLSRALTGISEALAASGRTFDAQQQEHEAQIGRVAGSLNLPAV